jgi:hypothetical protein
MKLYIWEGNGISDAWHNDGTLVVLAESPEHARKVVAQTRIAAKAASRKAAPAHAGIREEMQALADAHGGWSAKLWEKPEGRALQKRQTKVLARVTELNDLLPDGSPSAMDREPDRVVEITKPRIVAFNGGGYD